MKKVLLVLSAMVIALSASADVLVSWNARGLSADKGGWPSPWQPAKTASGVEVVQGLTRGVGLSPAPLNNGWGGNGFDRPSAQAAVATGQFLTFAVKPASGRSIDFSSIKMNVRLTDRAVNEGVLYQWQYRIGNGAYEPIGEPQHIATSKGTVYDTNGIKIPALSLSGIAALQSVSQPVEFRLLSWKADAKNARYGFVFGRFAEDDLVVSGSVK